MADPNKARINPIAATAEHARVQQLRSVFDDTMVPYFTRAIVRDVDTIGGALDEFNPINSIVADIIELGVTATSPVFYPMFSSHIMLPIKVGEEVWVMFENISNVTQGYWISRTPELVQTDNINKADPHIKSKLRFFTDSTIDAAEGVSASDIIGPPVPEPSQDKTSERAEGENLGLESRFVEDLVPIYRKESTGDFVIQGSNNALISFTSDRREKDEKKDENKSGTIDIVVGRGNNEQTKPNEKNGTRDGEKNKETEGVISYTDDSARILVTMNSNADTNFKTTPQGGVNDDSKSFIVQKSDSIRLIARSSIKIETQPGGDNNSSIVIKPDGEIIIHANNGKKIKLGSDKAETEPAVLGAMLKQILEDFVATLGRIHSIPTGAGPSGPISSAPNYAGETSAWKNTLENFLSDKTYLDDKGD